MEMFSFLSHDKRKINLIVFAFCELLKDHARQAALEELFFLGIITFVSMAPGFPLSQPFLHHYILAHADTAPHACHKMKHFQLYPCLHPSQTWCCLAGQFLNIIFLCRYNFLVVQSDPSQRQRYFCQWDATVFLVQKVLVVEPDVRLLLNFTLAAFSINSNSWNKNQVDPETAFSVESSLNSHQCANSSVFYVTNTVIFVQTKADCLFRRVDYLQCIPSGFHMSYSVSIPCFNMNGSKWDLKMQSEMGPKPITIFGSRKIRISDILADILCIIF